MNDKPVNGIWGPDGFIALDGAQPTKQELKPGLGEWMRQWADVAPVLEISPQCNRCGTVFQGKNSDSAKVYSIVCKCRELVWSNRDYVPPTTFELYDKH